MGRRGPAPAPLALKLLTDVKPYRRNEREPVAPDEPPTCPDWVDAEVRAEFDILVAHLAELHIARAVDEAAVLLFARARVDYRRACELIDSLGPLVPGSRKNTVRNPAYAMQAQAAAIITRMSQEFGLTPSARSRVAAVRPEVPGFNPFAEGPMV